MTRQLDQQRCPHADELAALASGRDVSSRVAHHVQNCQTCCQILDSLEREAEFIDELRAAVRTALDERVRRDVMNACQAALDQEQPPPDQTRT